MRFFLLIITLISSSCISAETWFENSSVLHQAHQRLLENDLKGSFSSIIKVWQADVDAHVADHLNELFLQSLDNDCGKSIAINAIPPWINNITVKRQSVQSPGRIVSRVLIEIRSNAPIVQISLEEWATGPISNDSDIEVNRSDSDMLYRVNYDLPQRLPKGLYRLDVKHENGDLWSTWVVLEESVSKRVVRWDTINSWAVDNHGLPNIYCPLPVVTVSLFDYVNKEYIRVWHQEYESDYPTNLPEQALKAGRYVLAVGVTHKRWQGPILIEDQQVVSKTHDISSD